MQRALLLINVESGSEDEVLKKLKSFKGVEETYVSYGVYDLIMKIKAETMNELKELVIHKIRAIGKVQSTLTLMMVEQ
jgi:DNA-binding Lrp family transcriptional regulator